MEKKQLFGYDFDNAIKCAAEKLKTVFKFSVMLVEYAVEMAYRRKDKGSKK